MDATTRVSISVNARELCPRDDRGEADRRSAPWSCAHQADKPLSLYNYCTGVPSRPGASPAQTFRLRLSIMALIL